MNQRLWLIAGAVFIVISLGSLLLFVVAGNFTRGLPREISIFDAAGSKEACDLFTDDEARSILGERARRTPESGVRPEQKPESLSSVCFYDNSRESISLFVREARTVSGLRGNKFNFRDTLEASDEVPGLKTKNSRACWRSDTRQLNVLAGNGRYWIVIHSNSEDSAASRQQALDLARLVSGKIKA